jgi:hypothetical protein
MFDGVNKKQYQCCVNLCKVFVDRFKEEYSLTVTYIDGSLIVDGVRDDVCEALVFPNSSTRGYFQSCKTNRLPYDTIVVGCLLIMSMVAGVNVTSDGSYQDWLNGRQLVSDVLGIDIDIPIETC